MVTDRVSDLKFTVPGLNLEMNFIFAIFVSFVPVHGISATARKPLNGPEKGSESSILPRSSFSVSPSNGTQWDFI